MTWLKKIGHTLGVILGIVAKDVKPVADIAAPVLAALLPQFSGVITEVDNVLNKIVAQAITVETLAASAGTASGTGPQKLAQVLSNVGPVIDQWVASKFPGATQISDAQKAGLVNAIVAILNEVSPKDVVPTLQP